MLSLDDMAIFAAVVQENGFSAAARVLNISTPVVSKRVSALEAQLGARLLNRTTRRLSLTEAGSVFYRHCSRVVSEAQEAEAAVTYLNEVPRGLLRVTAPVTVGSHQLTHALVGFMELYPEVQIELDVSDRPVDLAEDGYDVAIRVTSNPPPQLAARLLTPTLRVVCAAPEYWERCGRPQVPQDLDEHDCIVYLPNPDFNVWRFEGPAGAVSVPVNGRFKVNNTMAMIEAAKGGLGVIMLTSFLVERGLASGELEQVLQAYRSSSGRIYALYLPNRYLSSKTRAFIDYLVEWYARSSVVS